MKAKFSTRAISVFLAVLMLSSVFAPASFAATDYSKLPGGFLNTYETTYDLISGLKEVDFYINNAGMGNQIKCHSLEIDLSNKSLSIVAGYNDGDTEGWGRATLTDQAAAMEKKRNTTVVAGLSGDYFNKDNGAPSGVLVMNGVVGKTANNRPYFAILKNGQAVIRDGKVPITDVQEAIGGARILVKEGKNLIPNNNPACNPSAAVGVTAEGNVIFFQADGRQIPDSYGMTVYQVAQTMVALGCVSALDLDKGGSATFATRRQSDNNFAVRNSLAYMSERPISDTLLVCTTDKKTGEFDHVSFSSNKYLCNSNSYVTLEPKGVDKFGYSAKLPSGGKLVLEDKSYGRIVGNRFTASGKLGTVKVNYVVDDKTVGSTVVEVSLDADNPFVSFFKRIVQTFRNLIQLVKFAFEKIKNGEKY